MVFNIVHRQWWANPNLIVYDTDAVSDIVDVVFRIFVGLEYECPRGHRFFLCAPDRLFKVPPTGIYKVCHHTGVFCIMLDVSWFWHIIYDWHVYTEVACAGLCSFKNGPTLFPYGDVGSLTVVACSNFSRKKWHKNCKNWLRSATRVTVKL